jgi:hypothetical protein
MIFKYPSYLNDKITITYLKSKHIVWLQSQHCVLCKPNKLPLPLKAAINYLKKQGKNCMVEEPSNVK